MRQFLLFLGASELLLQDDKVRDIHVCVFDSEVGAKVNSSFGGLDGL